ncbi:long-chain-fatty-acid--CoA ligase [Mycolicibacterium thermoresistibile]|jgi:fatty-acyl-CoA synthase|uniref:Long-chain-fatty-acid--CoA ligase FadD13 n=2 Tax=Mycolicibacterium thermoresistibile TaxID=1797 RepID=G7CI79_MYCT3|nr:long-chain-fatty-acid--CoA ligase [Mycolicibacterium thermoresistibile]EHI11289.1 AMP-dependent synthetase and ligase [Mycolicibacterium thermoresistibile ATCC 19527]MCV7190413.1 long-chain-fatty-acid--CoA ligase [Mycolicibacterium thermoresistibile]GAT14224.1 AMP-dependent synthetase and ligase [Mycolicibacterium thermoresistibile]SNW20775.1 acyl-CoA synthetase [Mycolicibacterium thermoresistibile]
MSSSTPHPNTALTWVEQVGKHARSQPDRPALRFRGATTTWAQLEERSRKLATALESRGVGHGDRVLILLTNRPEFVETLVAVNRLGAIAVPVNFRLVAAEVAYLAQNSGAGAVVVEQDLAPLVAGVREQRSDVACLVVGSDPDGAGPGAELYTDAVASAAPHPGTGPDDLRTCALIMYTSGTTGRPKGAMLSYQNLLGQTLTLTRAYNFVRNDEVVAVTSPMFHIAAIGALVPNLILGYPTVITPTGGFDAEEFLDLLESEGVTNAFLVPTQWQALCSSPTVRDRKLRLRTISWGASPATPALLRAMAEVFPDAANVCTFGQTEMSPVTTVLDGADTIEKLGSVGRPVPLVDARIVDADMNDVPQGEVGEIVYRGPQTMLGYWDNPEETAKAFRGGWFHSGDLVRADEDGYLYVVDRLKDMIISGGENVYCTEVEAAIAEHLKVREVAVVGAPHPKWGETPVAVVVPRDPDDPPGSDELIEFTSTRLASYKKPTRVVVVDALPRNASGKVLKAPLRDAVRDDS